MNIVESIKRPFSDWTKLGIGILMYIIPFVNFITQFIGMGYSLQCAKTAMKKHYKLPEWDNWAGLLVTGLLSMVIGLIYFIPTLAVILIVGGTVGVAAITGFSNDSAATIAAAAGGLGLGLVLILALLILTSYVMPVAILKYIVDGKFGAAFKFGEVFKKAFTGQYLVAWIVTLLAMFIIQTIAGLLAAAFAITVVLPLVVIAASSMISGIIMWTLLGEAVA
jgi:hypothetical protein